MLSKKGGSLRAAAFIKRIVFAAIIVFLAALVLAGTFSASTESVVAIQSPSEYLGSYTFEQTYTEADGTVAEVQASGDQYYNYMHDGAGFILTPSEDGYLYYARSEKGRPYPSEVRWNAPFGEVNALNKMTLADVDFSLNPDLKNSFTSDSISEPLYASPSVSVVYNVIIFIQFSDESYTSQDFTPEIKDAFSNDSGTYYSLNNYYRQMTYNEKSLYNVSAYNSSTDQENNLYYIYKDSKPRSHYEQELTGTDAEKSAQRRGIEGPLLRGALEGFNSAAVRDGYSSANLDTDSDGEVDSISFVVMGSTSDAWGSVLWPHQWDVYSAGVGSSIYLSGTTKRAGVFSFQFMTPTNSKPYVYSVLAHEMGHVFGAPDYYSYESGASFFPVAEWDLMGNTNATTTHYQSNMLVYTRKKYMGMSGGVVRTVNSAQTITLKSTATATETDVVAIKFDTDLPGVSIFAEYRKKAETGLFDSGLSVSGLVVYLVNENVSSGNGNTKATSLTDYNNLEVLVYRPAYSGGDGKNAAYWGAVSPTNKKTSFLSGYDFTAIGEGTEYPLTYAAGRSLAVNITALSEDAENNTITFAIGGSGVTVDDDYFIGRAGLTSASYVSGVNDAEGQARYGVSVGLNFLGLDTAKLRSLDVSLYDAAGALTATATAGTAALSAYHDISATPTAQTATVLMDVFSKGADSWFKTTSYGTAPPTEAKLTVTDADGDVIVLTESINISQGGLDWADDIVARAEYYRLRGVSLSETYFEKTAGSVLSLTIDGLLSSTITTASIQWDYDDTVFTNYYYSSIAKSFSWNITTGALEGSVHTLTLALTSDYVTVYTDVKVRIVSTATTFTAVLASDGDNSHLLGLDWNTHEASVNIGGQEVALASIEPYSFNPWKLGEQTVYFDYGTMHYSYIVKINDRALFVDVDTDAEVLVYGQDLPNATFTVYFASGSTAVGTMASAVEQGTLSVSGYDRNMYGEQQVTLSYTHATGGGAVTDTYVVYVQQVVDVVLNGETDVYLSETYYLAEYTAEHTVNFGTLNLSFKRITGPSSSVNVVAEYKPDTSSAVEFFFTVSFESSVSTAGNYEATVTYYQYLNSNLYMLGIMENVKFRVLNSVTGVSIVYQGEDTLSVEAGYNVLYYGDREDWVFKRKITYSDSTEKIVDFDFVADRTRLDVGYSLTTEYLGHTSAAYPIIVKNNVVSLRVTVVESFFGEAIVLEASVVLADGTVVAIGETDYYYIDGTAYQPTGALGVAQALSLQLSAEYERLKPGVSITTTVYASPVDGVKSVAISDYEDEYRYGASEFVVYYLTVVKYYNTVPRIMAATDLNYTVSGFNSTDIIGTVLSVNKSVTLTYQGKSDTVQVIVYNRAATTVLTSPALNPTSKMYERSGSSATDDFIVSVTYDNGAVETLNVPVTDTTLNTDTIGKSSVSVVVKKNLETLTSFTAPVLIYTVIGNLYSPLLKNLDDTAISTITLRHGEALDLTMFKVVWGSNSEILSYSKARISAETPRYSVYQSVTNGNSSAKIEVFSLVRRSGAMLIYTVPLKILPRIAQDVLSIKGQSEFTSAITLDNVAQTIVLSQPLKVSELMSALQSNYLTLSYSTDRTAADYAGGYETVNNTKTRFAVLVENVAGEVIEKYMVTLKGDANGDGLLTSADVDAFADALLEDSAEDYMRSAVGDTIDVDSFVKWLLDFNATGANPAPTAQDFFGGFVCDGIKKRDVAI